MTINPVILYRFALVAFTIYFILIATWTSNDVINFGVGLGALFFYYFSILCVILLTVILLLSFLKAEKKWMKVIVKVCAFIAIGIAIVLTYHFTIGRGFEKHWNGVIFNP